MIKNFYNMPPALIENCHEGTGTIQVVNIFEKFDTPMQFLHYTVLPPGTTIGLHQHQNNEEFYIVLEGQGEMEVDGHIEAVTPGSVIKNKPYGTHGLKNTSPTQALKILIFEVSN